MAGQSVVVIVSEDPRTSHRAHEGMRIALGIVASDTPVRLVLAGPGAHLLDEDTDDLVDGDDIAKVRASLKKLGIAFHVEATAIPVEPGWNADGHAVTPVSAGDIAALVSGATRAVVF